MIRYFLRLGVICIPLALAAQTTGMLNLYPPNPAGEQAALNQAVAEANGSAIELTHNLQHFLGQYPNSPQRAAIEATLYKNAVDANDDALIVVYGRKVLNANANPNDELAILDRVTLAMIATNNADSAKEALVYAKRYEAGVAAMRARNPEGHTTAAQWTDLADRALSRATFIEARANGNLGNFEAALTAAHQSWSLLPTAEAAREIGRWLVKLNRDAEALDYYADAVTIEDPRVTWGERDRDRKTATALYTKLHGSEQGLGDVFLHAWDRAAAAVHDRVAHFQGMDPNYGRDNIFDFILTGVGDKTPLKLSTLKHRTVVVDFWATWCLPCVAQHPLIEKLKQKYAASPNIVFLSLDADDDHSLVEPFLQAQKWNDRVYLEGGLAGLLTVTSLPTILVINPNGQIQSRMLGFTADAFERMLSSRIDEADAGFPN